MMRTLVVGGAGFIGSNLTMGLLSRGHAVRVLDDLSSGQRAQLSGPAAHPNYLGLVEGGIAEERTLREALSGVDTVFHAAGRAQVQRSLDSPADAFASDVAGTFRLLEEVRQRKLRLVFVSSCQVYGSVAVSGVHSEDHLPRPASPHAGCKLAAEALVRSAARSSGLLCTIVRLTSVYGPGQRTDREGGVVSIFCRRALSGQPLRVLGTGYQTRDLLYVDDAVSLLCTAAENDVAAGEVLNGGTGLDLSINDLAARICHAPFARPGASPETMIEHGPHPYLHCDVTRQRCDFTRARQLLGWHPQVALDDGLSRTADWIRRSL